MDGYLLNRRQFGNWGGSLPVTALTGPTTLVTAGFKSQNQIYLQGVRLHIAIGQAGTTWTLADSAGRAITGPLSAVTAPADFNFDFGPEGYALTPGTNLVFTPSSAGAVGVIAWDAFQKLRTDVAVLP